MTQLSSSVWTHESVPPPTAEEVSAASAELKRLLLQRVKLSNDIARMRKLFKRLTLSANCYRPEGKPLLEERWSTRPSGSPEHDRSPIAASALRRAPANARNMRPRQSKLGRACRIALMETNEPASVETIYDRIERRGSVALAGKRPFRAIVLAMNALVKQGEASLLDEANRRRWVLGGGTSTV